MCLKVDLTPKSTRKLLFLTVAFFAQKVIRQEMVSQRVVIPVKVTQTRRIAKVTIKVFSSQMDLKVVLINKSDVTKLAERMSSITGFVGISSLSMSGQLFTGVILALT
jgi:hypothetical protein